MLKLRSLFIALAISAMVLAGCGGSEEEKTPSASSSSSATGEEASDSSRWNAYVDLFNSDNTFSFAGKYLQATGTDEAPTVDDFSLNRFTGTVNIGGRTMTPEYADALNPVLEKAKASPQSELDLSTERYVEGLKKLRQGIYEAYVYYAARSHLDDGLEKGKTIHTAILTAYQESMEAYQSFAANMDKKNRELMLSEVKEMRKNGMSIVPSSLEFSIAAQSLADELKRQGLDEDTVYKLDAAAFEPFYKTLTDSLQTLEKEGTSEKYLTKEGLYKERVQTVTNSARKLKGIAANIKEKAAKGAPEPQSGPRMVRPLEMGKIGDTPEAYFNALDLFTTSYNRMVEVRKSR